MARIDSQRTGRPLLAVFLALLMAGMAPAPGLRAAPTADSTVFAVRAGSYPVRRWADQAAARWLRKGVYAFVSPAPRSDSGERFRVYLGKFSSESAALSLAGILTEKRLVSPTVRIEPVTRTLCRHRQAVCDGKHDSEKPSASAAKDAGRPALALKRQPNPPAKPKKTPDHYRLIRSILGGAGSPEDRVVEMDADVAAGQTGPPSSPGLSGPFDLVPVTGP